jgi:hypothetical protein
MSEIQETDKLMRIMAIGSGIIVFVESVLQFFNLSILPWGGWIGGLVGILLAVCIIFLGIRPIHYTPVILGVIGVVLIIFAVLLGGIAVLLATFIGAVS